MPRQWRRYIDRSNMIISRSCQLAYLQWAAGLTYYVENPCYVGFMASPYFKWSKRHTVSLWITTPFRALARDTKPLYGTTAACGWVGPADWFQKLTTVASAGPASHPVRTINAVQCTHRSHKMLAYGVDAKGRQLSQLAGQYVPLF